VRQGIAASRRNAAAVGNQAGRHTLTVGNELAADREGVLHARALIVRQCGKWRKGSGKKRERKGTAEFHRILLEKSADPTAGAATLYMTREEEKGSERFLLATIPR
jgi:hypothetical protein